jgi:hypothetical protein
VKITIVNILDFLGDVMEAWRDAWVDFISLHVQKMHHKMESTNLMPHMELPTLRPWSSSPHWYLHFHITQHFGNETKLFKYDLQLPYQPIPNSIIGFKKTYCNMMKLPIYK